MLVLQFWLAVTGLPKNVTTLDLLSIDSYLIMFSLVLRHNSLGKTHFAFPNNAWRQQRRFCENKKFNPVLLNYIACPLTKTKLRYDEKMQELICDELGSPTEVHIHEL